MFFIEKNNILTVILTVFILSAFIYRFYDVFFKKYGEKGSLHYGWTLPCLSVTHSLIGVFSAIEFSALLKTYNLIVGLCALLLFLIAQGIRNAAILALGNLHSPHIEIKEHHRIVSSGIYSRIRHPYYLGVMIEVLMTPLVLNAYYTVLFALVFYFPLMIIRLVLEEKVLAAHFGKFFFKYKSEVPRFFPKVKKIEHLNFKSKESQI